MVVWEASGPVADAASEVFVVRDVPINTIK